MLAGLEPDSEATSTAVVACTASETASSGLPPALSDALAMMKCPPAARGFTRHSRVVTCTLPSSERRQPWGALQRQDDTLGLNLSGGAMPLMMCFSFHPRPSAQPGLPFAERKGEGRTCSAAIELITHLWSGRSDTESGERGRKGPRCVALQCRCTLQQCTFHIVKHTP